MNSKLITTESSHMYRSNSWVKKCKIWIRMAFHLYEVALKYECNSISSSFGIVLLAACQKKKNNIKLKEILHKRDTINRITLTVSKRISIHSSFERRQTCLKLEAFYSKYGWVRVKMKKVALPFQLTYHSDSIYICIQKNSTSYRLIILSYAGIVLGLKIWGA